MDARKDNGALCLDRRESLIICAGKEPKRKTVIELKERYAAPKRETELDDWYIGDEKIRPGSRTESEKWKDFCGTLRYETEFDIDLKDVKKIVLDMGAVAEQAEVYLNGSYAGYKMWAPYEVDLTGFVRSGKNKLEIEVTNSLANKYGNVKLPSGLLGRSVLKIY